MYRGYTQDKFVMDPKRLRKTKDRSCGYYMRIIFFFSSLIQSLIIVSLVLFLVYGQSRDSGEEKRVQELEHSCNDILTQKRLVQEQNNDLRKELNLTKVARATEGKELLSLRVLANHSFLIIKNLEKKLQSMGEAEKTTRSNLRCPVLPTTTVHAKTQSEKIDQLQMLLILERTNFTQTVQQLITELEDAKNKAGSLQQSEGQLRRQKASLEKTMEIFTRKCKEDFTKSLQGIGNVTNTFLKKIESFFSPSNTFHITCDKQKAYLEQIHKNCTNLSSDMESKFQMYLDHVGHTVSQTRKSNSDLTAQKEELLMDLQECQRNRSTNAEDSNRRLKEALEKHSRDMNQMHKEKKKLQDDKELLDQRLKLKGIDVSILNGVIQSLNTSLLLCSTKSAPLAPKPPVFPGLIAGQGAPSIYQRPNSGIGVSVPKPAGPGMVGTGMSIPWMSGTGTGGLKPGVIPNSVASNAQPELSDINTHMKELQKYATVG